MADRIKSWFPFPTGILALLLLFIFSAAAPAELVDTKPAGCIDNEDDALTPLHRAVIAGDLRHVKTLLGQGADIDAAPTYLKCTPNPKSRKEQYFTYQRQVHAPLFYAIESRNEDVVKLLLARGAKVDVLVPGSGWQPIHTAVWMDQPGMVALLVKAGADINASAQYGHCPLVCAVDKNNVKMIDYLLDRGGNLNWRAEDGETLLHRAVIMGNGDAAAALLKAGLSPNVADGKGNRPLHRVSTENAPDLTRVLLSKGAEINARNNKGQTPLMVAARWKDKKYLQILITHGADAKMRDEKQRTALHHACSRDAGRNGIPIDKLELLAAQGLDVNDVDVQGKSPLFHTIQKPSQPNCLPNAPMRLDCIDCPKAAAWLIGRGAGVNITDNDGLTPLHWAVIRKSDVFNILLDMGADILKQDLEGNTPLHLAASHYRDEMVAKLLRHGAAVNARNLAGDTPLHVILKRPTRTSQHSMTGCPGETVFYNEEIVKLLLAGGADPNGKNGQGRSPLSLARENHNPKIIDLLKKTGAKESSQ